MIAAPLQFCVPYELQSEAAYRAALRASPHQHQPPSMTDLPSPNSVRSLTTVVSLNLWFYSPTAAFRLMIHSDYYRLTMCKQQRLPA